MVEAGAGPEHGRTILQALSRIDLKAAEGRRDKRDVGLWERLEAERTGALSSTMILYVSCSSHQEDLERLERLRLRGAPVLWIWPWTARQEAESEALSGSGQDVSAYHGRIKRWRVEE